MNVPEKPLSYAFSDVNDAYPYMQGVVGYFGQWEDTRNGRALAMSVPVTVAHHMPWHRVLFDPKRDANPYLHYMEAIWMLGGGENVEFPARFAKQIREYSDDGVTLHGAYGYRWQHHFGRDQIDAVIAMLKKDPSSRRVVVSMWDPAADLEVGSKDLPCNTHLYFRIVDGRLTMTICNRSNDLVWGMLGANIVHMSVLQEYVANCCELPTGTMYQFTNNLHVYEGWEGENKITIRHENWYSQNPNIKRWLFGDRNLDLSEATIFVDELDTDYPYQSRIMRDNVLPMFRSHNAYKAGDMGLAIHHASGIYDEDWKRACLMWLERRQK